MKFRQYLNAKHDFLIIDINKNKKLPAYPFVTFQDINEDRFDTLSNESSEVVNGGIDILETQQKRIESVAQFDVYGTSYDEINVVIDELINGCNFGYREDLIENGFGIIDISNVTDLSSLEVTETRYRKSFDITYEYNVIHTKTSPNANAINFGTSDNPNTEKVER